MAFVSDGSDRSGEFVERGGDTELFVDRVTAKFVVAAAKVLHERMPTDDDARRSIAFQAAHRSQPRLQSCMVGLDPIVRVHGCVVLDVAQLVLDGSAQRLGLVGGDLLRTSVLTEDTPEEAAGRGPVASG